jgi:hypothetical protein
MELYTKISTEAGEELEEGPIATPFPSESAYQSPF